MLRACSYPGSPGSSSRPASAAGGSREEMSVGSIRPGSATASIAASDPVDRSIVRVDAGPAPAARVPGGRLAAVVLGRGAGARLHAVLGVAGRRDARGGGGAVAAGPHEPP